MPLNLDGYAKVVQQKKVFDPVMLEIILASLVVEKWRFFSVICLQWKFVTILVLFFKKYSIWEHGILLYFNDRCFRTKSPF